MPHSELNQCLSQEMYRLGDVQPKEMMANSELNLCPAQEMC